MSDGPLDSSYLLVHNRDMNGNRERYRLNEGRLSIDFKHDILRRLATDPIPRNTSLPRQPQLPES
jgi:hypothetical protein